MIPDRPVSQQALDAGTIQPTEAAPHDSRTVARGRARKWLARFGIAGFFFFLAKGLVWLVLMFVVYEGCTA